MTIVRPQESSDSAELLPAEALIEEARMRQRRRRVAVALLLLLIGTGAASWLIVAGASGGPSLPRTVQGGNEPPSPPRSVLSSVEVSQAIVESCASTRGYGLPSQVNPAKLRFVELKSGVVEGMPWSFWAAPTAGAPDYSLLAGSGEGTLCVSAGTWGGNPKEWDGYAQLPGKPVAFLFGFAKPSSLSRVTAKINGLEVSATTRRFNSSSYGYLFAEVAGLRCAPPLAGSTGIVESETDYVGSRVIGSGRSGSTTAGVPCGAAVPSLETLSGDLVAAPQPLRTAVLQTLDGSDVTIATSTEHPLSAHSWLTTTATYQSPDRYRGAYTPIQCGSAAGSDGPVATVVIGSLQYRVEESCVDGQLVRTGSAAPKVERATTVGEDGFTPAQLAAFEPLLTEIHTATSFRAIPSGFAFTSDLNPTEGGYVAYGAPTSGTITVASGMITSITSSSYYLGCEPLGPSCHFTSSMTFATTHPAPVIEVPIASDYLAGPANTSNHGAPLPIASSGPALVTSSALSGPRTYELSVQHGELALSNGCIVKLLNPTTLRVSSTASGCTSSRAQTLATSAAGQLTSSYVRGTGQVEISFVFSKTHRSTLVTTVDPGAFGNAGSTSGGGAYWIYLPGIESSAQAGSLLEVSLSSGRIEHRYAAAAGWNPRMAVDDDGFWMTQTTGGPCVENCPLWHVANGSSQLVTVRDIGIGAEWFIAAGHSLYVDEVVGDPSDLTQTIWRFDGPSARRRLRHSWSVAAVSRGHRLRGRRDTSVRLLHALADRPRTRSSWVWGLRHVEPDASRPNRPSDRTAGVCRHAWFKGRGVHPLPLGNRTSSVHGWIVLLPRRLAPSSSRRLPASGESDAVEN